MKKKLSNVFLLLIMALCAGPWRTAAQDLLTVADSTATNNYVPIYGLYMDDYIRTQIIYPEDMLTDMVGSTISELTFYLSSLPSNPGNWTSVLNIRMGTVTETAFAATSPAYLTVPDEIVYTGTMDGSSNQMSIELEVPYYYEGGNLLVEFASVTDGGYSGAYFYGINSTGSSVCGYSSSGLSGITPFNCDFIPKTTFTYTAGDVSCHPVGVPIASGITSTSAVITWATPVDGSSYIVQYKTDNQSWDNPNVVTDYTTDTTYDFAGSLNPMTTYNVRIANYCGGTDTSSWRNITFTTDCGVISVLPYIMDFEGYPSNGYPVPQCWTRVVASNSYSSIYPYVANSSYSAYEGGGYLSFYPYGYNIIALPVFADDVNMLRMTFYMKPGGNTASYGHMDVGVLTNLADTSTFQLVQTWEAIDLTSSYQLFVVDFNDVNVTDTAYIAFRCAVENGYSWYVDNLTVLPIPACLEPVDVMATTPDAFTANVTWSGGTAPYTVYYKTSAEEEYTSIGDITDSTYVITGLVPVTQYQIYVSSGCPDGSESVSQVGTFTTPCDAFATPFFEDFNTGTTIPDCWQRFVGFVSDAFADSTINETTSGWNFNNNYAFGQYHARLNIYGTASKYWLVTPQIDLSSLSSPALGFDMALTRYNTSNPIDNDTTEQLDDKFMVIISTDNGATWSASNATVWDNTGNGDYVYNRISSICEHVTIDLTQYAGQSVRIAFYGESTITGGDNDLHIDNVSVDEMPACLAPTQVFVTNVTGTSADISWTENGTSTSWTVEYGPAGFEDGSGTIVNVSGTPSLSTNGLSPATQYEVRISSDCMSDTVCKLFFTGCMPISTVPYSWDFESNLFAGTSAYPLPSCWSRIVPSNAGSSLYPYVTSSSTYAHSGSYTLYFSNYYGTQYAIMPELDVTALDLSNLMVTFFARNSSTGTALEIGVMSDPTDTATFTVLQSVDPATSASTDPYVVSLTGAVGLGNYIAFRNITAGGSYTYTYVDDVTLMDLTGCIAPMQLTTIPATYSANLSWTGNASSYNLYYKVESDSEYVEIAGAVLDVNGSYELTGLTPNTTYRWYVTVICDDGSEVISPAVLFTTECAPEVVPFLEDFNGGTVIPDCWTTYSGFADSVFSGASMTASSSYWSFSNTQVFGANHPKINIYGTGVHNWLVSPAINLTGLNAPALTFDLALTKYNTAYPIENDSTAQMDDKFMVVISLDNGATWNAANATVWDNTAAGDHSYNHISAMGDEIAIPLTQYANQTIRIAFYGESTVAGGDNDLHIDNVRVDEQSVCASPTQFVVSNVTATSAELSWQANDATNWVVEYDTVGFTLGEGLQINVSGIPSTVLNGLEPSTDYDVYVYAVCDDGSTTNAAFRTFRTGCVALTDVPQTWDFDSDLSGGTASYPLPDCWRRITPSGSSTLYPYANNYTSSAHSGDRSLYFYNYYPQSIAILPSIDNTVLDITSLQVSFFAKISSVNNNVAFEVGVMTDPMDPSTFTPVQTLALTETYPTQAYEVPFMNYTGNGQYIAFRNTTTSTVYSSIYVDDVTLEYIPACSCPQNLTTVSTTETSATLSWESTASIFTLYYKSTTDNVWQSESNVTLNGGLYTLDNLTAATIYDWYVETACGIDTEQVSVTRQFSTMMIPVSLPYSTDFTTDQTWLLKNSTATNYWMMGVPTGDTEGALFITDNGTDAHYNVTSTAVVIAEKLFTMPSEDSVHVAFDVKVGGEGNSTPYDYLKVFFAPANEEYVASNTAATAQSGYSYSEYALDFSNYITQTGETTHVYKLSLTQDSVLHIDMMLPKPDASGLAKLVFMWRNDQSSGTQPGAVIRNFTINTGAGPVVANPTVATNAVDNISQTAATLHATITNPDNVTISAKGFEWKATSGGTYTQVAGTGTGNTFMADLTNLTPNTGYTYKAYITFNGTTVYGSEMIFTTLEQGADPCDVPTNLHTTDIQNESISIAWDAAPNVNSWNIQYKPVGGQLSSASSNTNNYTITGLTMNTEYEIQVQAVCANATSDWCAAITAQTTNVGIENWLSNSVSLYPNPAKEYVDIRVDGDLNVTMMEVYDVYGKLINTVNVIDNPTRINVSGLADGMYFVRVTTEEGVVTKTFVKR